MGKRNEKYLCDDIGGKGSDGAVRGRGQQAFISY